ncbi:hypothetical protein [Acidithiobacillus ferridurans]|jgi:hypothetical protein|uniref:hypothetical protein n=1 Tax=Acidithiobacillus ferridurans TaxID=1232575 RepID=UPI001C07C312|nr:hypothetical protein [Acidithiobacillus ferridurans]MBU2734104.1 hypothetical protein [Acidithiobacillus ferridurans]
MKRLTEKEFLASVLADVHQALTAAQSALDRGDTEDLAEHIIEAGFNLCMLLPGELVDISPGVWFDM